VNAAPEEKPAQPAAENESAPRFRYIVFVPRFVAGHIFAYPLAFVWAIASMPLAMHLHFDKLAPLEGQDQVIGEYVVRLVAWPAGVVFVLLHLCALVWAIEQRREKSQWFFFGGFGGLLVTGILFGAASWLWLLLR
jgi:hypothetical protein